MNKETLQQYGWQHIQDAFGSWIFKKDDYTLQYLYDKKVGYIAHDSPTDVQPQIIYRGKIENESTLELLMDLLFIEQMRPVLAD